MLAHRGVYQLFKLPKQTSVWPIFVQNDVTTAHLVPLEVYKGLYWQQTDQATQNSSL